MSHVSIRKNIGENIFVSENSDENWGEYLLIQLVGEYYIILGNATVFLIFALGTYDLCVCLGFASGYTSYFVLKDLIGSYVRMTSLLYRGYT